MSNIELYNPKTVGRWGLKPPPASLKVSQAIQNEITSFIKAFPNHDKNLLIIGKAPEVENITSYIVFQLVRESKIRLKPNVVRIPELLVLPPNDIPAKLNTPGTFDINLYLEIALVKWGPVQSTLLYNLFQSTFTTGQPFIATSGQHLDVIMDNLPTPLVDHLLAYTNILYLKGT